MTKTERLDWIDSAKGIGIFLVVYGHVARGLHAAGLPFELFEQIDKAIYAFHMPLFFTLSGYFFVKSSKKGINTYIKTKLATILYPYLAWSLIQIVIQFFASNYTNGNIGIDEVITFFMPRGQFWFLLALFFISVISIALYIKLGEKGLLIAICTSFMYTIINPEIPILDDTMKHLLFFNVGVHLYLNPVLKKTLVNDTKSLLVNCLLFTSLQYLLYCDLWQSNLFGIVISISGSLFIVQMCSLIKSPNNHFKKIGKQSMVIYILHILVASGTRIFVSKLFHLDTVWVHCIVGTLLGVYVPFTLYKVGLINRISFLFKYPVKNKLQITKNTSKN
jgi:fucose 4-O-acetylase-like acetyltransferase